MKDNSIPGMLLKIKNDETQEINLWSVEENGFIAVGNTKGNNLKTNICLRNKSVIDGKEVVG